MFAAAAAAAAAYDDVNASSVTSRGGSKRCRGGGVINANCHAICHAPTPISTCN